MADDYYIPEECDPRMQQELEEYEEWCAEQEKLKSEKGAVNEGLPSNQ